MINFIYDFCIHSNKVQERLNTKWGRYIIKNVKTISLVIFMLFLTSTLGACNTSSDIGDIYRRN